MHDREAAARQALTIGLRIGMAITNDRDEAADIAQEVAYDVLRSLHRLRDPAAFEAWARRIAVRHAMRALQRRRRDPLPAGDAGEPDDHPGREDPDLVIASRTALTAALRTLPPRQAMALVLRYVHDLPDREIAAALGCRRGTANALLSRGREALRHIPELQELANAMEMSR